MTTEPKNSVDELVEVDDTDLLEREEIEHDPEERRLEAQTDEGAQQLRPLAGESRTQELVLTGGPWPDVDDTMILNMGPQHPSTHGVLRIMMELDGETVLRAKPVIGYLHTGMEKTGEELTYVQGATNVTRMDYASPLVERARVLDGGRAAPRPRAARARHVDPHAARRAQPHRVAPAVPGHERHGPRRGLDDASTAGASASTRCACSRRSPACG